jgi:PAS domain S-box-containing protein
MKKMLTIEGSEQELAAALQLLREHGYVTSSATATTSARGELCNGQRYCDRDLFNTAPFGIFRSTRDGKLVSVNPSCARILGYDSPEDMIQLVNQTSIADALYECPEHRREVIASVLRHDGWQVFEERFRCKDGSMITCYFYYRVVPGQGDNPWEFEGYVEDISVRKEVEQALRLSQFIVDHASLGIMRGDAEARILFANEFWARKLGYTPAELCTMRFFDIDPNLKPELWQAHREKLIATGSNTFESLHRRKDGTSFPVEITVNYLKFGGASFSCSFAQDITERKQAEEALRENQEKFRVLAETSPTAIFLYQGEMIIYANPATERLFGYGHDELLRMTFWDWAHPDFKETVRERGLARLRGESVAVRYESRFVTKGGEDRWLVVSAGLIDYQGMPTGVASFLDITENKKAELQLRQSLAEKEVLLKEVHHRVKNNLQIVSTLLELQSDYIHEEYARRYIAESQERIRSMALVHEQLYRSKDLSSVNFAQYVEDLVLCLCQSVLVDPAHIRVQVAVDPIELEIDDAISCGLIVNELVSNAFKHAFPGDRGGVIAITGARAADGTVCLTVADTGVGLPAGLDFRETESLGLQIVNMLARQLRGTLEMGGNGGLTVAVTFPRRSSA